MRSPGEVEFLIEVSDGGVAPRVGDRAMVKRTMSKVFKVGDHVKWNSEAGSVSGVIARKVTSNTRYKGYLRHASRDEPQYIINSDKSDHVAIHKGSALHLIPARTKAKARKIERER